MRKPTPREELLSAYGGIAKDSLGGKGSTPPLPALSRSQSAAQGEGGCIDSPGKMKMLGKVPEAGGSVDESGDRLPVGIIEYVALIGPSSMPPVKLSIPKRNRLSSMSSSARRDEFGMHSAVDLASLDIEDEEEDEENMGASADEDDVFKVGTSQEELEEQDRVMDVQIYDRFPKQDYPKSPLPSKVEWFAFPEGSISFKALERPLPKISTFVMSGSGGSDEMFGACLTFFIRSDFARAGEAPSGIVLIEEDPALFEEEYLWWSATTEEEPCKSTSDAEDIQWSGVCICMLTRGPFVEQLCRLLLHIYYTDVIGSIISWETQAMIAFQLGGSRDIKPLKVGSSSLLVSLCLECPLPIPDLFSVQLKLPSPLEVTHELISSSRISIYPETRPDQDVLHDIVVEGVSFRVSTPEQLPDLQYDLLKYFEYLGPRAAVDCIGFALAEYKMLFHSSDLSKLPIICESLRSLIYPLKWSHVFVPVVPALLLDLIQAPVPFILGMLSDHIKEYPYDFLKDVVIINCDAGFVDTSRLGVKLPSFPLDIDRWLMLAVNMIMHPPTALEGTATTRSSQGEEANMGLLSNISSSRQLQMMVFDVMVGILRHVPGCLFFVNQRTPVFNRPLFLSKFVSHDSSAFLELLINSNSFHQFIASINTPALYLFIRCTQLDPLFYADKSLENLKSSPRGSPPPTRQGSLKKESLATALNISLNIGTQSALTKKRSLSPRNSSENRLRVLPEWIVGNDWNGLFISLRIVLAKRLAVYSLLNDSMLHERKVNSVLTRHLPVCVIEVQASAFSKDGVTNSSSQDDSVVPLSGPRRGSITSAPMKSLKPQFGIQGSIQRRESINLSRKSSKDTAERRNSFSTTVAAVPRRKVSFDGSVSLDQVQLMRSTDSNALSEDNIELPVLATVSSDSMRLPLPTVLLDIVDLVNIAREMKNWTVRDLSEVIKVEPNLIAKFLRKSQEAGRHLNLASSSRTRSTLTLGVDSNHSHLDESVVFFLQTAFLADSATDHDIDSALFSCSSALNESSQRLALVNILGQTQTSSDGDSTVKGSWKLFPVHSSVFKALHRLSNVFMQCCASQDDYIAAYKLLEVGGKYCCTERGTDDDDADHKDESSFGSSLGEDSTLFLSDHIRHHLIYQNTSLWAAVIQSRLPSTVAIVNTELLTSEVHSLLREMHGVGVNFDRALLFIQSIAEDYRMEVDSYFDLQRFMTDLWEEDAGTREEPLDIEVEGTHPPVEGARFEDNQQDLIISLSLDEDDVTEENQAKRRSTFFRMNSNFPGRTTQQERSLSHEDSANSLNPTEKNPRKRRSIFEVSPDDLTIEGVDSRSTSIDKSVNDSILLEVGRKSLEIAELNRQVSGDAALTRLSERSMGPPDLTLGTQPNSPSRDDYEGSQLSTSPKNRLVMEFAAEEYDDLEVMFENISELQGTSRPDSGRNKSGMFSMFSFRRTSKQSRSSINEDTSSNDAQLSAFSPSIIACNGDSNDENPAPMNAIQGKGATELYEEVQLIDRTGKSRKGSAVTSIHTGSRWLVIGTEAGVVELFDMDIGRQVAAVSHKEAISSVRCLDNASGFVSACRGGIVKVWKMPKYVRSRAIQYASDARRKEVIFYF